MTDKPKEQRPPKLVDVDERSHVKLTNAESDEAERQDLTALVTARDHVLVTMAATISPTQPAQASHIAGFRTRQSLSAQGQADGTATRVTASEPGVTAASHDANTITKPNFTIGIMLSTVMFFSCIIGISTPLHQFLLPAGISSPFMPGTLGFLDLFFILVPIVACYWSVCLFKLSDALTYKSASARRSALMASLSIPAINPVLFGAIILIINHLHIFFGSSQPDLACTVSSLCLMVIPFLSNRWYLRFVARVMALAPESNQTAQSKMWLACAFSLCYLVPFLLFNFAIYYCPPVLNASWQPMVSYSWNILAFAIPLVLALLSSALGQGLSFYILKRSLKDVHVLRRPSEFE